MEARFFMTKKKQCMKYSLSLANTRQETARQETTATDVHVRLETLAEHVRGNN